MVKCLPPSRSSGDSWGWALLLCPPPVAGGRAPAGGRCSGLEDCPLSPAANRCPRSLGLTSAVESGCDHEWNLVLAVAGQQFHAEGWLMALVAQRRYLGSSVGLGGQWDRKISLSSVLGTPVKRQMGRRRDGWGTCTKAAKDGARRKPFKVFALIPAGDSGGDTNPAAGEGVSPGLAGAGGTRRAVQEQQEDAGCLLSLGWAAQTSLQCFGSSKQAQQFPTVYKWKDSDGGPETSGGYEAPSMSSWGTCGFSVTAWHFISCFLLRDNSE